MDFGSSSCSRSLGYDPCIHVFITFVTARSFGFSWKSPRMNHSIRGAFWDLRGPHMWRFAVISFLTAALLAKLLSSVLSDRELWVLLADQYRWWSVKVDHFTSKDVRNPTERCSSFRRIAKRLWNQANIPSSSIAYPLFCQHLNKEQAPTFLLTFRICLQVA